MTCLVLALNAEGATDERFLPILVQRTAEQILAQRGRTSVDILEPILLRPIIDHPSMNRAECIREAARRSAGYHALIVHADADHPTPERALQERYRPGLELVQEARHAHEPVCDYLLPIVPVQMTEAWLLADPDALRTAIGSAADAHVLGLPSRAGDVESDPNPKRTLNQAVQRALADRPRRRRRMDLRTLYEPMARQVNLCRLAGVPAYRQFASELTQALIALHMAE